VNPFPSSSSQASFSSVELSVTSKGPVAQTSTAIVQAWPDGAHVQSLQSRLSSTSR
jgi:hypothetical protein